MTPEYEDEMPKRPSMPLLKYAACAAVITILMVATFVNSGFSVFLELVVYSLTYGHLHR